VVDLLRRSGGGAAELARRTFESRVARTCCGSAAGEQTWEGQVYVTSLSDLVRPLPAPGLGTRKRLLCCQGRLFLWARARAGHGQRKRAERSHPVTEQGRSPKRGAAAAERPHCLLRRWMSGAPCAATCRPAAPARAASARSCASLARRPRPCSSSHTGTRARATSRRCAQAAVSRAARRSKGSERHCSAGSRRHVARLRAGRRRCQMQGRRGTSGPCLQPA